jgi:hypothetical protein
MQVPMITMGMRLGWPMHLGSFISARSVRPAVCQRRFRRTMLLSTPWITEVPVQGPRSCVPRRSHSTILPFTPRGPLLWPNCSLVNRIA